MYLLMNMKHKQIACFHEYQFMILCVRCKVNCLCFIIFFLMISSSNFFKKTFFTIQHQQKAQKPKNEPYGPWSQQVDQVLVYKNRRSATKHRYIHKQNSLLERQNEQELTSRSSMSKSLLLAGEQSIVQKVSRGKSFKQRKNKIIHEKQEKIQTKLPAIKINDSQNESLRKSIIKLQGGLLNFITNNHQRSLKKFVSKREQSGPKFEMYKKCLIAARRMMQEGQYNTLFYNS